MMKLIILIMFLLGLTGCQLAETERTLVGAGIFVSSENVMFDASVTDEHPHLRVVMLPLEGNDVDLGQTFNPQVHIHDDQIQLEHTVFLRSGVECFLYRVALVEKNGQALVERIDSMGVMFGKSGGNIDDSFKLPSNPVWSTATVKTTIEFADSLIGLKIISFNDNHEVISVVDGQNMEVFTMTSAYIVIEERRQALDGTVSTIRTAYSDDDTFNYPVFEGDNVIASFRSLEIKREGQP